MGEVLPSLVVGLIIVVIGATMLIGHIDQRKRITNDESGDESENFHLHSRCRRRLQTSGMIVLVGILIPIGDIVIWPLGPKISTYFWGGVLLIVGWIAILAMADFVAARTHTRVALARVRQKQSELESQIALMTKSNRDNGRKNKVN